MFTRYPIHCFSDPATRANTVQKLLDDVKAKYDAAVQGQAGAQGELNNITSARKQIELSMGSIGSQVLKGCEEIRWGLRG